MVQARRQKQKKGAPSSGAATTAAAASGASTIATSAGHSAAAQSYFHGAVSNYQAAAVHGGRPSAVDAAGPASPRAADGASTPPPPPPPAAHDPAPTGAAAEARAAVAPSQPGSANVAAVQQPSGGNANVAAVPPPPPSLPPAPDEDDDGGIVLNGRQNLEAAMAAPPPPPLAFESDGIQMTAAGQPIIIDNKGKKACVSSAHTDLTASIRVIGGTREQAQEYDVGFIQTVLGVRRKFRYGGRPGGPNVRLQTVPANTRDAHKGTPEPWYNNREPVTDTGRKFDVKMDDGPEARVDWKEGLPQLNQIQYLESSEGKDRFCAWIVARPSKGGGDVIYIAWTEWEVDWGARYDGKAKTGQATTGKLTRVGGGDGKGGHAPSLAGEPANKQGVASWVNE